MSRSDSSFKYRSMSRSGSTTRPTPRSGSATTKLALPNSPAGTASTVYMSLTELDRHCRQENPDRDQSDDHRSAVGNDLRGHALRRFHTEVGEQVSDPVGDVKERHCDQHEQVELDDRIAEHGHPGVVVAVNDGNDAEWTQDALDQDVHRDQHSRDDAALSEKKPIDEVRVGDAPSPSRPAADLPMNGEDIFPNAHRANQIRTNPTTTEAAA